MSEEQSMSLGALRQRIDAVDNELLAILGQRQALVEQVIAAKMKEGLPARIPQRVSEVIELVTKQAPGHGVSPALAHTVWTAMIEWFIAHEEKALAARR